MIERGELWWVDLGEPRGSAPEMRRPVLVVSADAYNRSRIATVVCVTVTTNLRLADAPGNVLLDSDDSGLSQDSVANVSQIITLDKEDLVERLGCVGDAEMALVEAGLRRVLELSRKHWRTTWPGAARLRRASRALSPPRRFCVDHQSPLVRLRPDG